MEANALFGGIEIRVPETWNVTVRGAGIFGGYEDKTMDSRAAPDAKQPHLIINGFAIFGGVTIQELAHASDLLQQSVIRGVHGWCGSSSADCWPACCGCLEHSRWRESAELAVPLVRVLRLLLSHAVVHVPPPAPA